MPMSFDGLAANTSGWSIGPRARGTGSIGCAARIQHSLPIGHYATATAEHREPYESRGSRTVLGAPEGESPSGDSSFSTEMACPSHVCFPPDSDHSADIWGGPFRAMNRHGPSFEHIVGAGEDGSGMSRPAVPSAPRRPGCTV